MSRHAENLIGSVFGRLTVLHRTRKITKSRHARWLCHCSCGREITATSNNLRYGAIRSCGCLRKELTSQRFAAVFTHGHTRHGRNSPTYRSWRSMINRCTLKKFSRYSFYGGASPPVRICARWLDSFQAFLEDLGERPEGTTLGRFGDSGNYEPGNAIWMTRKEQEIHRRLKVDSRRKDRDGHQSTTSQRITHL
jgi:hypothetical protein